MNEIKVFFSFSSLRKRLWPSHLTGARVLILLKTGQIGEIIGRFIGEIGEVIEGVF